MGGLHHIFVYAFGYICLTAHIDFSGREGLCLVGIAASSLLSCGIGALVGALPGRMGSDSRRGILTALTCLLSLFAGLYGEPTMELADTVAHAFPAATWLNPVCLIRDLFYTVTSSIVVVAGVVLSTLNKPDVRRRQLAAPVSSWRMGFESIAGCAVLALGVCAWVALVGIGASGAGALLSSAGAQVALAIASLCAFALVPLSLAYTLAQFGFREEALNAIANLGGMIMSFLGGAWVPLSLMGANVQAVAHFTPTFWMYDAVTCALGAQEVNASVLATVGIDLGIIALFAVAIVSAGLVAARLRVREV